MVKVAKVAAVCALAVRLAAAGSSSPRVLSASFMPLAAVFALLLAAALALRVVPTRRRV